MNRENPMSDLKRGSKVKTRPERRSIVRRWMIGLLSLCGLGLAGLAFFANRFGLDVENSWGPGRRIVAVAGISLLVLALLLLTWKHWMALGRWLKDGLRRRGLRLLDLPLVRRLRQVVQAWKAAWTRSRLGRWCAARIQAPARRAGAWLRATRLVRYFAASQDRKAGLAAIVLGAAILVIYVWLVSVGFWKDWPQTTLYYNQLADAFLKGQPNLLIEPEPGLLALEDPYNYDNRQNVGYPWDTVFYHGKFYLYWGPAPALILTLVKAIHPMEIGDQVLVFGFVSGIWLFATLLILRLRRRLFPNLAWTFVIPAVAMAGLANPLPWLLSRPQVYEAAIAGGQFFLVAGLYAAFAAAEGARPSSWKAALASLLWLCAIASRLTLAPAVLFFMAATAWYLFRQQRNLAGPLALVLPFAAGVVALGWYNYIRFGSWTETGMGYMLTGINFHALGWSAFSPADLFYNLHNYFLNPFRRLEVFPYVKPDWGGRFIFFPIAGSAYSNSEQVSGLILTVPYLVLAVGPLILLLRRGWQAAALHLRRNPVPDNRPSDGFLVWTAFLLSGGLLLALAPILLFVTTSMRYLADGVPLMTLLAALGFWLATQGLTGKPGARGWFVILVVVVAIYSVVISWLLAITGYQARFEHLNPILFDQLTHLLTP
jgi:hypothetical protein